ncbi:TonB-dependent receptor [Novosphingobium sp. Gsoil 351]|nr:TonB-dependent receptor [Novosphingobium sp. Gsoil 351]QGN56300.1 TonB-dependent receptor [Novosphingobium sp. Gsoil 351]
MILASATAFASPSLAQSAPADPSSPAPDEAQGERADQSEPHGGLGEIVVTATRREQRLQEVPVAVTAITAEALGRSGAADLRNLTQVVPGFFGGRAAGVFLPVIRGVGSNSISVGDESNIATYVDGIYQGDPFSTWTDLVKIDRVEVLRGPQGTIFGRNATGGLINVITPDPKFDFGGLVSARAASVETGAGDYNLRGYLTGGLSDTLAADIAGIYRKSDNFVDDVVRGGKAGGYRVVDVRSKVMRRSGSGDKIVVVGEYFDRSGSENVYQPYDDNTAGRAFPGAILPSKPWQFSTDLRPGLRTRRYSVALQTRFDLGALNLETTGAYAHNRLFQATDSDSSNILLATFVAPKITSEYYSQEVRLLSAAPGPFQWIAGAYAFHLTGDANFILSSRTTPSQPLLVRTFDPLLKTTSYAGFAEGTLEVVPSLFVTGGIRYTYEKRSFDQVVNGVPLFAQTARKSFDKVTYKGTVRYEIGHQTNIYATYSTGFKSGVFNMTGSAPVAVNPESIKALEGGIKSDITPWLRANLALYRYDYKDLQVTARDPLGPGYILQNAANATIYGGELETTLAPTDTFRVSGAIAYAHAEYDEFPAAQVFIPRPTGGNVVSQADVSGNRLPRTPRWTFNIAPSLDIPLESGTININGTLFHSSTVYFDFLNLTRQDPYTSINAEISWKTADEKFRFSLWTTNLTNEKIIQEVRPGALGTDLRYELPRRIGAGVEVTF